VVTDPGTIHPIPGFNRCTNIKSTACDYSNGNPEVKSAHRISDQFHCILTLFTS
jgi:hypothetical protein